MQSKGFLLVPYLLVMLLISGCEHFPNREAEFAPLARELNSLLESAPLGTIDEVLAAARIRDTRIQDLRAGSMGIYMLREGDPEARRLINERFANLERMEHLQLRRLLGGRMRILAASASHYRQNSSENQAQNIIDQVIAQLATVYPMDKACSLVTGTHQEKMHVFGISETAAWALHRSCTPMNMTPEDRRFLMREVFHARLARKHIFILVDGTEPFSSFTLPDNTVLYVFQRGTIDAAGLFARVAHEIGIQFDGKYLVDNYFFEQNLSGNIDIHGGPTQELICALNQPDLRKVLQVQRAFSFEVNAVVRLGLKDQGLGNVRPLGSTCQERLQLTANSITPSLQELSREYRTSQSIFRRLTRENSLNQCPTQLTFAEASSLLANYSLATTKQESFNLFRGPESRRTTNGMATSACDFFSSSFVDLGLFIESYGPRPRIGGHGSGTGRRGD